jgi:hypothetical protein
VKAAGWWPVWEMCHTAWAPRQTATATEMVPYAKLLGDHDPADVLEALEECSTAWRPVPGHLRGYLNERRGQNHRVDVGRARDRSVSPEAIAAAADALRRGGRVCKCGCPTSRKWLIGTDSGVLRCSTCDGLEQGQLFKAEDAGLLEEAA